MKVTNIIVDSISVKETGVCGEFSIELDNSLCIHKVLVVRGKKGLFITFPNSGSRNKGSDNKRYMDVVHPTNNELRQYIQKKVLDFYESEVSKIEA